MPALEGGATRIVDWMDQNLHDLFIPTYYHLLPSLFFAYVLRNIKIDALFDVAYIKCKERKKDWRKNKAVFIFNLFCFVKGETQGKNVARPSAEIEVFSQVHYQEFWFPSFCMRDCFCFWINASKSLSVLISSRERKRRSKFKLKYDAYWNKLHFFVVVSVVSVRFVVCIHGWNHWNHEHYDNF